jgi:hypothetical protein
MYMVYKVVSTAVDNRMVEWGSGGASAWPYSNGNLYINFGATGQYFCGAPTGASMSAGYRIFSVYSDTNDWSFYVDGGTGGPTGGTSPLSHQTTNTVSWTSTAPYLGVENAFSIFTDGWIAEIYFTNAHQSTADRQKNEGYLAWKWGLQGNLDPSHPYKSGAPTVSVPMVGIGDPVDSGTDGSVLFIHPAEILAQDNPHFTFDPINNILNVGDTSDVGSYYIDTIPALFRVPNAAGDNWFAGNSGNRTVTGYGNFANGAGCMAALTSGTGNLGLGTKSPTGTGQATFHNMTNGQNNTAVGNSALSSVTSGSFNVALGTATLCYSTTDNNNIAVGNIALETLGISGSGGGDNICIGAAGMAACHTGNSNVCMGSSALNAVSSAVQNVIIGSGSGTSVTTSNFNTMVGPLAGYNLTGSCTYNTLIGAWRGPTNTLNNVVSLSDGDYNNLLLEFNYQTANVWSFGYNFSINHGVGIHVYNLEDAHPPTNYERAILDWTATANIFRIGSQAGGTGTVRLIAVDGFQKAGAPAAGDLPSGSFALINDTSGGQTWLAYNAAGTIRKVQLT